MCCESHLGAGKTFVGVLTKHLKWCFKATNSIRKLRCIITNMIEYNIEKTGISLQYSIFKCWCFKKSKARYQATLLINTWISVGTKKIKKKKTYPVYRLTYSVLIPSHTFPRSSWTLGLKVSSFDGRPSDSKKPMYLLNRGCRESKSIALLKKNYVYSISANFMIPTLTNSLMLFGTKTRKKRSK